MFIYNWLVVWNMNFMFPYIGNSNPNWHSYFSEGLEPPTRYNWYSFNYGIWYNIPKSWIWGPQNYGDICYSITYPPIVGTLHPKRMVRIDELHWLSLDPNLPQLRELSMIFWGIGWNHQSRHFQFWDEVDTKDPQLMCAYRPFQVYLPYPDEQVGKNGLKVPEKALQTTTFSHTLREG